MCGSGTGCALRLCRSLGVGVWIALLVLSGPLGTAGCVVAGAGACLLWRDEPETVLLLASGWLMAVGLGTLVLG